MLAAPTSRLQLITLTHPQSPAAEAYRQLGTALRFEMRPGCLLAASPTPKEAPGRLLGNLGVVLAQGGCPVILVDADLRHPRLHLLLGTPLSPGLGDLLHNPSLDISPLDTAIPGLRLLPAGSPEPNPAALLASPGVDRILGHLKPQADYLLLTSPPTLVAADAALIAARVDGVVLVIKPGVTKRPQVRETQSILARVNAKLVGVILDHGP